MTRRYASKGGAFSAPPLLVAGPPAKPGPARSTMGTARGWEAGSGLTVVFPCYNEAERLPHTLATHLAALSQRPGEVEVLVVDDGSTDATLAVANAVAARDPRVRVLSKESNHGKGFAVRTGMLAARGELLVFTDADGSYGPGEVDKVVAALAEAPVAIGARPARAEAGSLARRLASRLFNHAIQLLVGLPYRDTQCGLKAFRRAAALEVFGRARLDGFAFDVEVLVVARGLGLHVKEVGVHAEQRDGSKVQLAADALRMLRDVLAVRRSAGRGRYARTSRGEPAEPTTAPGVGQPIELG